MQSHLDPDKILDMVTSSLDSDKAEDVLSIPLGGKSSVADYMVIASGTSSRQVAAMAEHLEFRLNRPVSKSWALKDCAKRTGCLLMRMT